MLAFFYCRATVAVQNLLEVLCLPFSGTGCPMMRRRHFLALLGSVSLARSQPVSAQSAIRTYRVGLFNRGAPITDKSPFGAALLRGLEKRGYVLGRNLELVSRGAGGRFDLLPGLLEELVASNVEVIVAGGYPAVLTKPDHHSARRASMRPQYRGAVGRCEADQQLGRRSGAQCGCRSPSLSIRLSAWESETSQ